MITGSDGICMKFGRIPFSLTFGVLLCMPGAAQAPIQPVRWAGSVTPGFVAVPEKKTAIDISAEIQDGWHVYALQQPPGGPTPLRVTLDENDIVAGAGATFGSAPTRKQDQSFNLETQFYTRSIALHVPVKVKPHPPGGNQSVSLSVRFQACSDRVCLPPRTVHVIVPIQVVGQ